MQATEESEIFLGTLMEYSSLQLHELEARLDAEEMERNHLRESLSSLEFHSSKTPLPSPPLELEEKCEEIVAIGRASVSEREPSAEARTQQQHDHETTINYQSIIKNQPRGVRGLIRLLAEIAVLLIVGISVLNGEFTSSQPANLFSQQATQQQNNRPSMDIMPSQLCCPEQQVQPSCYVVEIWDVYDLNACGSDQIDEDAPTPLQNDDDDEQQDEAGDTDDQWQIVRQHDVSTFRVILSTATGQVHHFAFAFVNLPLVHGCALRRLRV